MAKWVIREEGKKLSVSYENSKGVQDLGRCGSNERKEMYAWLYSEGQVDPFDVVVDGNREFFTQLCWGEA